MAEPFTAARAITVNVVGIRWILRRHSGIQLFLAVALLGSCKSGREAAQSTPESSGALRPLNVVVVTIDTLRADHLGCYGEQQLRRPTSTRWRPVAPYLKTQSRRPR